MYFLYILNKQNNKCKISVFFVYGLFGQHVTCFGCGSTLKLSGVIGEPPGDLVIVSFMRRQYRRR